MIDKVDKKDGNPHNVFVTRWWQSEGILIVLAGYDTTDSPQCYWRVQESWTQHARLFKTNECFETLKQAQADVNMRVEKKISSLAKQRNKLVGWRPAVKDGRGKKTLKESTLVTGASFRGGFAEKL